MGSHGRRDAMRLYIRLWSRKTAEHSGKVTEKTLAKHEDTKPKLQSIYNTLTADAKPTHIRPKIQSCCLKHRQFEKYDYNIIKLKNIIFSL